MKEVADAIYEPAISIAARGGTVTFGDLSDILKGIGHKIAKIDTPSEVESLVRQAEDLQRQLAAATENNEALGTENKSLRTENKELANELIPLRAENQRLQKHITKLDEKASVSVGYSHASAWNPTGKLVFTSQIEYKPAEGIPAEATLSGFQYNPQNLLREALVIIDSHRRNTGGEGDMIAHSIRTLGIDYGPNEPNRQPNAITELTAKVAALTTENDRWNKIAALAQARIDELMKERDAATAELSKRPSLSDLVTLNDQVMALRKQCDKSDCTIKKQTERIRQLLTLISQANEITNTLRNQLARSKE